MNRAITLLFLMLFTLAASAQNDIEVSGVVKADDGSSLPGVSIRVRGTQRGTSTDLNGIYKIKVAKGNVLDFSFIGFKPQSVTIGKASKVNVTLHEDTQQIEQVVVTGYTQSDIRKTTGSVGILTEKDLKDAPLAGTDMLMQGKLAGVNVQAVSGRPGESAKIRIRGTSSITGNNEPLWVVDGVPLQKDIPSMGSSYVRSGDFSTIYANGVAGINPQDIESITVLKDAAAAAIYGSQAQAGVIVITTKKGKEGKLHMSYSGSVSVQTKPSRDPNLMNTEEKLAYEQSIWDEFSAPGFANGGWYPRVGIVGQVRSGYGQFKGMSKEEQDAYLEGLKSTNTDWFDVLFHNTVSTNHHLSASGGTDRLTYYVSAGVGTNKGIVHRTASDSYNFSAKINAKPSDKISFNVQADYSYLKSLSSSNGFDMFRYAYFANPYEKPYNEDGSYASDNTFYSMPLVNGSTILPLPQNGVNVMREINETTGIATAGSTTIRGDVTWRISDHFRLFGLASYTNSTDLSDNEVGQDTYTAWQDRPFDSLMATSKRIYGNLTQSNTVNRGWLARAQANYSQTFDTKHYVALVFGTEVRNNYAKQMNAKHYGYDPVTGNHSTPYIYDRFNGAYTLSDMQQYQSIVNGTVYQSRTENAFASFYGAADYIYNNKYVFNVTGRSDGSNNFGAKEQFNMTWSLGTAWNIDEEAFFEHLKPVISRATLRLSCGLTGGVNKSVYPVLIMNYSSTYRNSDTQAYRTGMIQNAPNPHLRWERTQDWNGSLDMGFLDNRLSFNLSFYRRKGYDLVTSERVVSSTGFTSQSYNTSEQLNQGVEAMLGATIIRNKDWSWSLSGNVAYNQNKLTKYKSVSGSALGDIYVGYPLGKIFTGKCAGIDPATGMYGYELRPDADLSLSEGSYKNYLFYLGTSNYPWTGGLSTNLRWKQLSLSVSSSFSIGAKLQNIIRPESSYSQLFGKTNNNIPTAWNDLYMAHLNVRKEAAHRWTPDNPVTDGYPRLIDAYGNTLDINSSQYFSSTITAGAYYEGGSYWKINSATLMYSFDDRILRKLGVTSLGVNFTANNLWTITKYKGFSPETPGATYPLSRAFTMGVNVGF